VPVSRKSLRKAGRVVRYRLKDGTLQVKRYPAYTPKNVRPRGDTVGDLEAAWERSPKWQKLARRTQDQYVTYMRDLSSMAHVPVGKVARRDLLDLRDAVAEARGHGAAIGFARATSALFSFAVDREWIDHSPATKLQKDLEHGHLPAWEPHEAALALRELPEHLRRAVVLALHTGQRRGDLSALRWGQYDGRVLRLEQEKTEVRLVIPLLKECRGELDAWRKEGGVVAMPSRTILVNKFGKPWQGSNLSKQLGEALATIPGFPPHRNIHGLRKLAAANLAHAGCTLHEISAITGHKSLAMIQLYTASVNQEQAAEAAIIKLGQARDRPG
jgi:integrase